MKFIHSFILSTFYRKKIPDLMPGPLGGKKNKQKTSGHSKFRSEKNNLITAILIKITYFNNKDSFI